MRTADDDALLAVEVRGTAEPREIGVSTRPLLTST